VPAYNHLRADWHTQYSVRWPDMAAPLQLFTRPNGGCFKLRPFNSPLTISLSHARPVIARDLCFRIMVLNRWRSLLRFHWQLIICFAPHFHKIQLTAKKIKSGDLLMNIYSSKQTQTSRPIWQDKTFSKSLFPSYPDILISQSTAPVKDSRDRSKLWLLPDPASF